MRRRDATDEDYEALVGGPLPAAWYGLTVLDAAGGRALIAMAWLAEDGRWWAGVEAAPAASRPRVALCKAALEIVEFARERGIALHTMIDERVPSAQAWMEWLGFAPSDETIGGATVWVR